MTVPSIVRDMSFVDYLAHPAYGSSDLRAFRQGPPAIVPWRRDHRDDETSATRIGKAAHCAILTPDLFAASFQVKPEGMEFRSKENKALRDKWRAEGRSILSQDEWSQIQQIVRAFHSKAPAAASLESAVACEASVFWKCRTTGLLRKCRPDWWAGGFAYDLKVSIDAEKSLDSLAYKAHANGWANQLANDRAGLNECGERIKGGRLVVIAPNPPQELRVWMLEYREADLDFLEMENEDACKGIAACERSGHWPGTPDTWQTIELPASAAFTESDLEGALEVSSE